MVGAWRCISAGTSVTADDGGADGMQDRDTNPYQGTLGQEIMGIIQTKAPLTLPRAACLNDGG